MTIKNLTGAPTAKWSLEKLGQYCNERTDRMAVDAWLTGKAMAIAKAKTKHGRFSEWKRKWGYSDPTVSRYIRLYQVYKTPDALVGKGIMEALCEAGIHQKQATAPPTPVLTARAAVPAVAKRSSAKPTPTGPFPWAVGDTSEFEVPEPVEPNEGAITTETEIREEIAQLPASCSTVERQIEWILTQDTAVRRRAWPNEHNLAIKAAFARLRKAFGKLEKVIPK